MKYYYYDYDLRKPVTPICNCDLCEENFNFDKKIMIQIHIYFLDVIDEIITQLNHMPFSYDCYISTDTDEKKEIILEKIKNVRNSHKVIVGVFDNRGRDVLPFLSQAKKYIDEYDYICHIHSKKSETIEWGDAWRNHLYNNLFGDERYIKKIFYDMERDEELGMIFPEVYPLIQLAARWNGTENDVKNLLADMNITMDLSREPIFSAGTMFWAKTKAVKPIFNLNWENYSFPDENGQIDFTPAHAIERIWVYLIQSEGYTYDIYQNALSHELKYDKNRTLIYALDKNLIIDVRDDIDSILKLKGIYKSISVVSNKCLNVQEKETLQNVGINYIENEDLKFSFQLWKESLVNINLDNLEFDEITFMDNRCFGPILSVENMINRMDDIELDFYSIYGSIDKDSNYTYAISDYITFNKESVKCFKKFLVSIETNNIHSQEDFDKILSMNMRNEGLIMKVYCIESLYMGEMLNTPTPLEDLPYDFTIFNCPFIMKESVNRISVDAREAYQRYLSNLELGKRYITLFNKRTPKIWERIISKIKRK